jgi:hypothetical protein
VGPIGAVIATPGFVDTPLSASLLGDQLDKRRDQLRATLPIGRVVGRTDTAAPAVHIMTNTALTGASFDITAASSSSPGERKSVRLILGAQRRAEFSTGRDAELCEHLAHMPFDRARADEQLSWYS